MENQNISNSGEGANVIETTIGELVEVITAIAQSAGRTEMECYKLVSFTLEKLLRDKRHKEMSA